MMDAFADTAAPRPLESRKFSCQSLMDGLTAVLEDANIELPDDLEQLQEIGVVACVEFVLS